MKKQLKNKWIKALESGEFEQVQDDLRGPLHEIGADDDAVGFCCLGVLCEVAGWDRDVEGGYRIPVPLADLPDGNVRDLLNSDSAVTDVNIEGDTVFVSITGEFPDFMKKMLGLDKKAMVKGERKDVHHKLIGMNDAGTSFEKIAAYLKKINL